MATRDLSSIASALTVYFEERLTSQINRAVVLSQLLPHRPARGQNITWDAKFGAASPGTAVIADGADVTVFNVDTKIPAVLQFGTYHDAFSVTGKALASAAIAGNPAQLADLFADELMDSVERLARGIGVDTYAGAGGTDQIHGLTAAAGGIDSTGVYAGIDRAVQTQWAANETDATAAPLSFALMRAMRRDIYTSSGMKPDLIICDPATHEKYGLLFGSERRYVQEVRMRGEVIQLDGGYQVLEFDGIPVIEDVNCPAATMLFINTRHVNMTQLPDPATAANRSSGMVGLVGTPESQFGAGTTGLEARVVPLAVTGDAYKMALYCYPQIVVRRPNACGKLINFT